MNARKTTLAMVFGMMVAGGSWAGTLGSSSDDSTLIDLRIGEDGGGNSILIQRLGDIPLGEFSESNSLGRSENFCIYQTGSPDSFAFDLETESTSGEFTLQSGDNSISYGVAFQGSPGITGINNGTPLNYGDNLNLTADNGIGLNPNYTCVDDNVSIYVQANFTEASVAPPGDYSDTLTLIVSAQ